MSFMDLYFYLNSWIILILFLYFDRGFAQSVSYCSKDVILTLPTTNESYVDITTRRQRESNYRNDERCKWTVSTSQGWRIYVQVISMSLEWAPEDGICSYRDHVAVLNGTKDIITWCGKKNSPVQLASEGSDLTVTFWTDDRKTNAGATIRLTAFGPNDCPPNWVIQGSTCRLFSTTPGQFSEAQERCVLMRSNLAMPKTQDQTAQILSLLPTSSGRTESSDNLSALWIGVTDILKEGEYRWLDGQLVTDPRWSGGAHRSSWFLNCVVLGTGRGVLPRGSWREAYCTESQVRGQSSYRYVCERQRGPRTEVYTVPIETRDPTDPRESMDHTRVIAISCGIGAAVLVGLVLIGVFWYRRRQRERYTTPPDSPRAEPTAPPPSYSETMDKIRRESSNM